MLLCTTKNYCVLQNSIPGVSCTTKCDSVLVHYYGSPTNCYSVLQSTTLARLILRSLFLKREFLSNHCVNTPKKTTPVQHMSTSHRTDHTKKPGNRAFFCYTCCFVCRLADELLHKVQRRRLVGPADRGCHTTYHRDRQPVEVLVDFHGHKNRKEQVHGVKKDSGGRVDLPQSESAAHATCLLCPLLPMSCRVLHQHTLRRGGLVDRGSHIPAPGTCTWIFLSRSNDNTQCHTQSNFHKLQSIFFGGTCVQVREMSVKSRTLHCLRIFSTAQCNPKRNIKKNQPYRTRTMRQYTKGHFFYRIRDAKHRFDKPLCATESRTFLPHVLIGGGPCINR